MIGFTLVRYVVYCALALRGILLARFLGPERMGICGFLLLFQQYLLYCGLGIQFAVSVRLATSDEQDLAIRDRYISAAYVFAAAVAFLLGLLGLAVPAFAPLLFRKYHFAQYALVLALGTGMNLLVQVGTNVHRVVGTLKRIAAVEVMSATVLLLLVLSLRGERLLMGYFVGFIFTGLLGVAVFNWNPPYHLLRPNRALIGDLLRVGLPLLVYSASFFLIGIIAQTIVSYFYSVKEMGYYALANNITNAVLLGLNSVSWILFPVVLSKTRFGAEDDAVCRTVRRVNSLFAVTAFVIVFTALLFLPALFIFLPQFTPAMTTIGLLLLSQAVLAVSYGYNCVAMARERQLAAATASCIAVVMVAAFAMLVASFHLSFAWIALGVLAGCIVFTALQWRVVAPLLGDNAASLGLRSIFPTATIIALILGAIGSFSRYLPAFAFCGLAVFLLGNRREVLEVLAYIRRSRAALDSAPGVAVVAAP